MSPEDFKHWFADLSRKSPMLAQWLGSLPLDTIDEWRDEVFAGFDLRDALVVNIETREGVHDFTGFQRDKFLPTYIRRCSELRASRELHSAEREWQSQKRRRGGDAFASITKDAFMGPAFAEVRGKIDEWKSANDNKRVPDELLAQWSAEAAERVDRGDDQEKQPRFRCLRCQDSGYVSFRDSQGRPMAGSCDCVLGAQRFNQWADHRRGGLGKASRSQPVTEWVYADE